MEKERRSVSETITRITTIAMLSALGFVLMAFAQFPYPFAPWLKVEVSEIVTIIAYALYGLPGGIAVALIKTLLNLAVHGPVGLGIGDLTAFITSCMFILGLFLTSHVFKWFKKGLVFRIISVNDFKYAYSKNSFSCKTKSIRSQVVITKDRISYFFYAKYHGNH